jgi:hypothetical protein
MLRTFARERRTILLTEVPAKMKGAGVPCVRIGTTGGETIAIAGEAPVSVAALKAGLNAGFLHI